MDDEVAAAPADTADEKAGEPDGEEDRVAEGDEPPVAASNGVAEDAATDGENHKRTQNKISEEESGGEGRARGEDCAEDGPGEAVCEEHAGMTGGTNAAKAEIPEGLVAEVRREGLGGIDHGDGFGGELDAIATGGDALSDAEIFRVVIDHALVAADFGEAFSRDGNGGAGGPFEAAFGEAGNETVGPEIADETEGFESGDEGAVGEGAEENSDGADLGVFEGGGEGAEVVGGDADVAIGADEEVVAGFAGEAGKFIGFIVEAQLFAADEEADGAGGKIADEFFDDGDDGIFGIGDAEEDFVFGVVLAAEAGEIFIGGAVGAFDGNENAGGRSEIGDGAGARKAEDGEEAE